MSKKIIPSLAIACAVTLQSCSTAPTTPSINAQGNTPITSHQEGKFEVTPLIGNFKVKKAVYPNGLKLIVVQDTSSPTFAFHTWFNVGSRNEVVGRTGLAHLFEHLMFRGTKSHKDGEFDTLLEQAGVEGENAFTSNDHTAYHQELPKDQLDLIIGLESDRMVNLIVDDQSFKTEREVVKNERRMRTENSPEGVLYQTLFEMMYTDHPYHWPVIGYEQDLNIMNAQDARDFYEHYYSPDRATIVIVGDVDPDEVYKKIARAYGSIPAKNTPDIQPKMDPEQTAQRRKKVPLNIQNEKLWLAYHIPAQDSPESVTFEALQAVLSDGMNSRLDRALVDSGISSNVSSGSLSLKDPGFYVIMTELQKGKASSVAEAVILREIERLKNTLISDEELQRGKNLYRYHFLNRLTTSDGIAHFLGNEETAYGDFRKGIDFTKGVQNVTPLMIQDLVKKYFNTQNLTVLVGTPKK